MTIQDDYELKLEEAALLRREALRLNDTRSDAIRDFTKRLTHLVESPEFAAWWEETHYDAHQDMVPCPEGIRGCLVAHFGQIYFTRKVSSSKEES